MKRMMQQDILLTNGMEHVFIFIQAITAKRFGNGMIKRLITQIWDFKIKQQTGQIDRTIDTV